MRDTPSAEAGPEAREHSIPRLALAVITSPTDAFEEILARNLLVPGLLIAAAVGVLSAGVTLLEFYYRGQGSLFQLATANPAPYVGMLLMTALLADRLSRFLGGEGSYVQTVTVLGWAYVTVLVLLVPDAIPALSVLAWVGTIWSVVVSALGLARAHKMSFLRSAGSYIIATLAVGLAFAVLSKYYAGAACPHAVLGVPSHVRWSLTGQLVGSWLTTMALIIGVVLLARVRDGDSAAVRLLASLAVLGLASSAAVTAYVQKVDPLREVVRGVRAYQDTEDPDPARAARHFRRVLAYYPSDRWVRLYLANSLSASGDIRRAREEYGRVRKSPNNRLVEPVAVTGDGNAFYIEGNWSSARRSFDRAIKLWSRYAEPMARLALLELRLGKVRAAIKSAREAVDAGDEGCIPYVVLAQAYTIAGDEKGAESGVKKVRDRNPELATRLAAGPGGWGTAIEGLTPVDLRMPLQPPKARHARPARRSGAKNEDR